jgi:tetratricopeptide (TPR) repeat protein
MHALTVAQAKRAQNALALIGAKRATEALSQALALVAESPSASDAQHLLALCAAAAEQAELARTAFDRALAIFPAQPMYLENYAKFERQRGGFARALELRLDLHRLNPNLKNTLAVAQAALEAKNKALAVVYARKACSLDSKSADAWHCCGRAWQEIGELSEAAAAFTRALELQETASHHAALAYAHRISGKPKQAISSYRLALALEPDRADIQDGLTGAMIDDLDVVGALRHAQALVARAPEHPAAHETLADLNFCYSSDQAQALRATPFADAAARAPKNIGLQFSWIRFLLNSKQSARALDAINATRAHSNAPQLDILEANALEQLGNTDRSASLYQRADKHFGSHDVAFLNTYIRHLLRLGDFKLAAEKVAIALLIEPDYQESWAHQALIWRLLRDEREFWLCGYDHLVEQMPLDSDMDADAYAELLSQVGLSLDALQLSHHEPLVQSVRGGLQTPGVLFGRDIASIQTLAKIIKRTVDAWVQRLPIDAQHPFLRRKSAQLRFAGSWSVKLQRSGLHANHFHSHGWLSSAFYVSLPPAVTRADSHAGCIQFGQPPIELELQLAPRRIMRPQQGQLALFPSYLWHGTIPFEDSLPRVTVAFDVAAIPTALLLDSAGFDTTAKEPH